LIIYNYTIGNCDIEEDKKKKEAAAAQEMIPKRKVFANQAVATEEEMVSADFMKEQIAKVEEFYQAKFKEMEKEAKAHAEESSKVIGRLQRQIEKLEAELKA
jgi:polyhydroxyalkanoate synthesis regulator phasin